LSVIAPRGRPLISALAALAVAFGAAETKAQERTATVVNWEGTVQRSPRDRDAWLPVRRGEVLGADQRLRAAESSEAWLRLGRTEYQVWLRGNAVMQVGEACLELFGPGGARISGHSEPGKQAMCVVTPGGATTVLNGTDLNIDMQAGGVTVVTVLDGSVVLSNAFGEAVLGAGSQGTASPVAAPTRQVVDPTDAVQWTLFYPTWFAANDLDDELRNGPVGDAFRRLEGADPQGALAILQPLTALEPWARIGASLAYLASAQPGAALQVLSAPVPASNAAAYRAQLATALLRSGDRAGARAQVDTALAEDSVALRPLMLLTTIHLIENRKDSARELSRKVVAAHPGSVAAHIVAGQVSQSGFDLDEARGHFDAAIALDGRNAPALVQRARVRFGIGDIDGARADADLALQIAPGDPLALSLRGFLAFTEGRTDDARAAFEASIAQSGDWGEPHLGLGLVHVREQRLEDALAETANATLLEPSSAIYHSYLGKMFGQLRRFDAALAELETAKRLDPLDPTPWLYSSAILRDTHRPVEAIQALRESVRLNDNRAVYRGRLLLDSDLAIRNARLGRVYRTIGLTAWGRYEANNSLSMDFTEYTAHSLLSEDYQDLPDRSQAYRSEHLQALILTPVSGTSVISLNSYSPLFQPPSRSTLAILQGGNGGLLTLSAAASASNQHAGGFGSIFSESRDGGRPRRRDTFTRAYGAAKVALGRRASMFGALDLSDFNFGQYDSAVEVLSDGAQRLSMRRLGVVPDPDDFWERSNGRATLAYDFRSAPGTTLTLVGSIFNGRSNATTPDETVAEAGLLLPVDAVQRSPFVGYELEAQQVIRVRSAHQLIAGARIGEQQMHDTTAFRVYNPRDRRLLKDTTMTKSLTSRSGALWLRDDIELNRTLRATLGLRLELTEADSQDEEGNRARLLPQIGLRARIAESIVVRAAAFRSDGPQWRSTTIAPTAVTGFVLDRSELPGTRRSEFHLVLEGSSRRLFHGLHTYRRNSVVPLPLRNEVLPSTETTGARYDLNAILGNRWSFFGGAWYEATRSQPYLKHERVAMAGMNFSHEAGLDARIGASHMRQRFSRTKIDTLTGSSFTLFDVLTRYELPRKQGYIELAVLNLLDTRFNTFADLTVEKYPTTSRQLRLTIVAGGA
jgi:tetratricopeptide (TPR) repeat protein